MPNKSKNRWLDVQIILASLAVTSTVALWNIFARGTRPVASQTGAPNLDPTATLTSIPNPTATAVATAIATVTTDPNAPIQLPKVHILLGGQLPVAQVVVAPPPSVGNTSTQASQPKASGGSKSSPPPVTKTSSSKP